MAAWSFFGAPSMRGEVLDVLVQAKKDKRAR